MTGMHDWSRPTSADFTARLSAGDRAAWEKLATRYGDLVAYWCQDLQPQDRADIVQEVLLAAVKNPPADSVRGWLRTVTRRRIADLYRDKGRQPTAAEGGTLAQERLANVPELPADPAVETRLVVRSEFREKTWLAFQRTALDGLSSAEAGAELNMTPRAVRLARSRVLKRLREEMKRPAD